MEELSRDLTCLAVQHDHSGFSVENKEMRGEGKSQETKEETTAIIQARGEGVMHGGDDDGGSKKCSEF